MIVNYYKLQIRSNDSAVFTVADLQNSNMISIVLILMKYQFLSIKLRETKGINQWAHLTTPVNSIINTENQLQQSLNLQVSERVRKRI